jgi:hypothetical protein
MNAIFKNNIFNNPKGWAEKAIGSHKRYRFMQAVSVTMAGCLGYVLFLLWSEAHLPLAVYFAVLVFVVIGVVQLPFCYLRALRSFVVEAQLTKPLHSTPR